MTNKTTTNSKNTNTNQLCSTHWIWLSWFVQIILFIPFVYFCLNAYADTPQNLSLIINLIVNTCWLFIAFANCIIIKDRARSFIALTIIIVNPFLIPLSIYSCNNNLKIAIIASIVYTIAIIIITPRNIGICAFVSGVVYAFMQKFLITNLNITPSTIYIIKLSLAYLGLGAIAIAWKILITKLYEAFNYSNHSKKIKPDKDNQKLADELAQLAKEHQALKQGIAKHINTINQLKGSINNESKK